MRPMGQPSDPSKTFVNLLSPLFLSAAQGTVAQPITVRMWSTMVHQIALQADLPHFTTRTFRQARVALFDRVFRHWY